MNLSDRDKALILKYLTGGAALGGGIALGQSGLNYMQFLRERSMRGKRTDKDDDTLYLNIPEKTAAIGGGMAIAGGSLSLLAANALVRKFYQQLLKKPELQAELDAAQRRHLNVLTGDITEEAEKQSAAGGHPMSGGELLTSSPVALAILTAIASGALGYQALNRTFPSVDKPRNPLPSKVKLVRKPAPPDAAEMEKDASWDDDAESAAWDYAAHQMIRSKEASEMDLADLAYAAAAGRYDELRSNMIDLGFDATCDLVKGATAEPVSDRALDLGVSLLVKSAALGPCVRLLIAAELNEQLPGFTKIASGLDDETSGALVGWLACQGAAYRTQTLGPWIVGMPKAASAVEGPPAQMEMMLKQLLQEQLQAESVNDRKDAQARVASNQTVSGSASETGTGQASDGAATQGTRDVPELVMGIA